jgi:hypothetical protein
LVAAGLTFTIKMRRPAQHLSRLPAHALAAAGWAAAAPLAVSGLRFAALHAVTLAGAES